MPRRMHLAVPSRPQSALVTLLLCALVVVAAAPRTDAAEQRPTGRAKRAKVALTQLKATGAKLSLAGTVTLPRDTAAARRRTRVAFSLTSAAGRSERFATGIDRRRAFRLTRTTKLTGRLTLTARVTIGGKASGTALARVLSVRARGRATTPSGGGGATTTPTPGGGATATPSPPPADAEKLVGTFRFDPGVSNPDGSHGGTWFRMFTPSWKPFANADSRSRDKTYTLLRPGTDGGLRTDAYQEPPTPYYDATGVLADKVIERERFFGAYFTIFTRSTDVADGGTKGLPTPLPEVFQKDGRLYGQVTAWTANWNGAPLFNQGSPKPDGTLPGYTAPLSGSYDPATRRYTLDWQSQIVGGGFNDYTGLWHLEGTFVPAG